MLALGDANRPIDGITLAAELEHRNALDKIGAQVDGISGGIDYLGEICQSVPHQLNATYYAGIVHEHTVKRAALFGLDEMRRTILGNGKTAAQVVDLMSTRVNRIAGLMAPEAEIEIRPWPDADKPGILYGLAGDIVRLISPHTEADPMAILGQFLVGFGSIVGRSPHWRVESTRHGVNLFACIVGSTSKARKGTSWDNVRWILSRCDETWAKDQVMSGLSTGEGLIYAVRDPVRKREKVQGGGYEEKEVDPGVTDKRACWVESEFESVLACMSRDANTLNAVIRQAYDGHLLRVATKNSPNRATDAHVSIIGHITDEALRAKLTRTDTANGFANRFLWVCARRARLLPHGGYMGREPTFPELLQRVEDAAQFARLEFAGDSAPICRTEEANRLWEQVYPRLTTSRPGMLGMVTSRAEAQVMRLAVVYALLDLEKWVRPDHLNAALAFWDYCDASAGYIFGDSLGDPDAEKLLAAIREAGESGLTVTDIRRRVFSGHLDTQSIQAKIAILVRRIGSPDRRSGRSQGQGLDGSLTVYQEKGGRPCALLAKKRRNSLPCPETNGTGAAGAHLRPHRRSWRRDRASGGPMWAQSAPSRCARSSRVNHGKDLRVVFRQGAHGRLPCVSDSPRRARPWAEQPEAKRPVRQLTVTIRRASVLVTMGRFAAVSSW